MTAMTVLRRARRSLRALAARLGARRRIPRGDTAAAVASPLPVMVHVRSNDIARVESWLEALAELDQHIAVGLLTRSARATVDLQSHTALPVVLAPGPSDVEAVLAAHSVSIVLELDADGPHADAVATAGVRRALVLDEADADAAPATALDRHDAVLVAGEAALDRLRSTRDGVDGESIAIPIGDPRADVVRRGATARADDRLVVLVMAPPDDAEQALGDPADTDPADTDPADTDPSDTDPSGTESSRVDPSESARTELAVVIEALVGTGRHRVLHEPAVRRGSPVGRSSPRIVEVLSRANRLDPLARHHWAGGDRHSDVSATEAAAATAAGALAVDVVLADTVSAARAALAGGAPVILTARAAATAWGEIAALPSVPDSRPAEVVPLVDRVLTDPRELARTSALAERCYGDTAPGASATRFRRAIESLLSAGPGDAESVGSLARGVEHAVPVGGR